MQLQVTPGGFAKCFAFCKTFRCTKSLKGLRTAKPPGDVTEARRDFVTSVQCMSSSGFYALTVRLSTKVAKISKLPGLRFTRYCLYTMFSAGFIPCCLVFSVGKTILFAKFWCGGWWCRSEERRVGKVWRSRWS